MAILPKILGAVVLVMVLTAPGTAATTPVREYRPAVMRMEYAAGDLTAVVCSPRTLVGTRPLVFQLRGDDHRVLSLAQQGSIVVLVSDRAALSRHVELWRQLSEADGPLAERFGGFAGHFSVAEP
jgi:hypothetical protein